MMVYQLAGVKKNSRMFSLIILLSLRCCNAASKQLKIGVVLHILSISLVNSSAHRIVYMQMRNQETARSGMQEIEKEEETMAHPGLCVASRLTRAATVISQL